MCFGLIWKDLFRTIKTSKLKYQLLWCYLSGIFFVMISLLFTLYTLLNVLQHASIKEIEDTLSEIATVNSQDFTGEYARTISNQLMNVAMLSSYMSYYMENLFKLDNNLPFKRPYITDFGSLPRDCAVRLASYDNQLVCMNYSSVFDYSNLTKKIVTEDLGYLAYIFPDILNVMSPLVHRILVFVPDEKTLVVFPGQNITNSYDPLKSIWYKTFKKNPYDYSFVPVYNDSINNSTSVISVVQPLRPKTKHETEVVLNVEIQESALYSLFPGNLYLYDNEEKILTTNQGEILKNPNSTRFNGYTYMKDYDKDLWNFALTLISDKNEFILKDDCFFRVSVQTIPANRTDVKDVWLFTFLFLKEKTIMKYKNESQDTLASFSNLILSITSVIIFIIITASVVVIILTGNSISRPLVGVKKLTDRINTGEVDIQQELDKLEEGNEQVADLVKAFKSLVTTVSNRRHAEIMKKWKKRIYPPNELFQAKRVVWKEYLKDIPN